MVAPTTPSPRAGFENRENLKEKNVQMPPDFFNGQVSVNTSKKKLNGRVTLCQSQTMRLTVKDRNFFENPAERSRDDLSGEAAYSAAARQGEVERQFSNLKGPAVQGTIESRQNKEPNLVEKLNLLLGEKEGNKFKYAGEYGLVLRDTNTLSWKKIKDISFLSFLAEKKAKKLTLEALNYIRVELEILHKKDESFSYQNFTPLFADLCENKICKLVFKEKPELKATFTEIIKQKTSVSKTTTG